MNSAGIERSFKATFALLFLLSYLIGNTQFELHRFNHADENALLHSANQEKDPCHLTLYHHATKNGCEHKTHISENHKCTLCDLSSHSHQVIISFRAETLFRFFDDYPISNLDAKLIDSDTNLPSRAPPSLVVS